MKVRSRIGKLTASFGSLAILLVSTVAGAACSRTIVVPAVPTGYSIITSGDSVSGVYPKILQELGKKYGCTFNFPVVPRARLERMFFKSYSADVMVPATRTPERDASASFVPLITVRPGIVTLDGRPITVSSVGDLRQSKLLRGATVRGFNYGGQYQDLLADLEREGRMEYVPNLSNVSAMMAKRRIDFSIMAPTLFYSTVAEDPEAKALLSRVQYRPIAGLDQVESGVYLSNTSLSTADLHEVKKLFEEAARSGLLWKTFQSYYPPEVMQGVISLR